MRLPTASLWHFLLVEENVSVVRSIDYGVNDRIVITFDHWRDASERVRPSPYGEQFLSERGIAHLNVFAHWNHWYQVEDMERVIGVINEEVGDFRERIVYGNSMGGFGSLQFAGRLAATMVIVVAPQYSMDVRKVPQEFRYRDDVRRIRQHWLGLHPSSQPGDEFLNDAIDDVILPHRTAVIYDPLDELDSEHVRLIARHHRIERIQVRGSGHWPEVALQRAGLLSMVIEGIISGQVGDGAVYDGPFD